MNQGRPFTSRSVHGTSIVLRGAPDSGTTNEAGVNAPSGQPSAGGTVGSADGLSDPSGHPSSSTSGQPTNNVPEGEVPPPPAPYDGDVPVGRYEHLDTPEEADRSLSRREIKSLRLRANSTEYPMTHKPKNPYCEACIILYPCEENGSS